MMRSMKAILIAAGFLGALSFGANAAPNLLVNGSFETGDFTGWTQSGNGGFTSVQFGSAQDGDFAVSAGPVGSDGLLSQTFTDTPGDILVVSGWLQGAGSSPSDFNMSFNGTTFITVNPVPSQGYTQYSFTVTATGSDTFTVGFRNDPSFDQFDNFSVTATPEPASLALLGAGIAGLGLIGRRKSA